MSTIRILRSAVGSSPSLGLIKELQKHDVEIIGMDCDSLSYGLYNLKKGFIVPKGVDEEAFVETIIKIIEKERPDAVLSGPEEELLTLSKNKERLEQKGTVILCPDYKTVNICSDKLLTHKKFEEIGIPMPKLFQNPEDATFPCIIKPRNGRGSVGIHICKDEDELLFFHKRVEEPIIEEFIEGTEYTVDVLADQDGNALSIVPRRRIGTESGLSVKGKTINDSEIIAYVKKISKKLKLFGPSCVQCIRKGNDIRFIEINNRFGGGAILSIKADPSIITNLLKIVKNEPVKPSDSFLEGLIMLRNYTELFIKEEDVKK